MEENESVEIQEVAEPVEEAVDTNESTQEVVEPETQNEKPVEETKTESRDYERDAAFAKMRRSMEQYQKDLEATKAEKERLVNAFGMFGFKGDTDEIEDQAKAHYTGRNIEEIRQERIAQAQKIAEENTLRDKLKYYEEKELKERMDRDLAEIQKINPAIRDFNDLPKEYFNYVSKGIEGTKAYKLLEIDGFFQAAQQQAEQKAVAKMQANAKASVGSAGGGQPKETVTYANMSDAEFEKLLEKVKRGEMTSIT